MYTEIKCPSCLKTVKAENIVPKKRKATCSSCGQHFDINKDLELRIRQKYEIFQPGSVTMLKTEQLLELSLPMGLLPKGCSFWPVFGGIGGTLTILLLVLSYARVGIFEHMFRFGIDYFLLGAFLATILLISFSIASKIKLVQNISTIDIKANKEKLVITHIDKNKNHSKDPEPTRTQKELQPNEISQFYVVEKNIGEHFFYSLSALGKSDNELEIIPFIKNLQLALFVEQELEYFYNIKDQKIKKEVKS